VGDFQLLSQPIAEVLRMIPSIERIRNMNVSTTELGSLDFRTLRNIVVSPELKRNDGSHDRDVIRKNKKQNISDIIISEKLGV